MWRVAQFRRSSCDWFAFTKMACALCEIQRSDILDLKCIAYGDAAVTSPGNEFDDRPDEVELRSLWKKQQANKNR